MRKITKEYTIAEFSELTKDQQSKIFDNLRYINVDHDWHSDTISEYTKDLESLGFSNVEIQFSGFASQGSGASFSGNFTIPTKTESNKRLKEFKERCEIKVFLTLAEELTSNKFSKEDKENGVNVYRLNSRYCHENTVASDCEFIDEWVKKYSRAIYRTLEYQNDYLISDEAIKETIEANEYEFDIDSLEIA